jgi:hypothetical protein
METIFDFSPTDEELESLRFTSLDFCLKFGIDIKEDLTPELYRKHITQKFAHYDLVLLFGLRKDTGNAEKYTKLYGGGSEMLGVDNKDIPS